MINYENIFNQRTLNIFADASVFKTGKYKNDGKEFMITCPGAMAVTSNDALPTNMILDRLYYSEPGTNNSGEIKAIRLGIMMALKYRHHFQTINLFSDSGICMQGLRTWIHGWMKNQVNGILYSSSGTEVANQVTFKNIIDDIIANNLNINLYHQRGHVHTMDEIKRAKKDFIKFNSLNCDVDIKIIETISTYNNYVDSLTRENLYKNYNNNQPVVYLSPAMVKDKYINNQDMKKYYELIRRK